MMASAGVAIGGGIAVKQMDVGTGDALILTNLGVIRPKVVK